MPPRKDKKEHKMETPKEYSKNLKNNILTTEMLIDCLFSVNKRAKNCRDKEREYRDKFRGCRYGDKYGTEEKYREKKRKIILTPISTRIPIFAHL